MDGLFIGGSGFAWQAISPQEARSVILYRQERCALFGLLAIKKGADVALTRLATPSHNRTPIRALRNSSRAADDVCVATSEKFVL